MVSNMAYLIYWPQDANLGINHCRSTVGPCFTHQSMACLLET